MNEVCWTNLRILHSCNKKKNHRRFEFIIPKKKIMGNNIYIPSSSSDAVFENEILSEGENETCMHACLCEVCMVESAETTY